MKQYKPGQFVSIDGKLARVSVNDCGMSICSRCCKENPENNNIMLGLCLYYEECIEKIGDLNKLYPKFIKQCGNQDK